MQINTEVRLSYANLTKHRSTKSTGMR